MTTVVKMDIEMKMLDKELEQARQEGFKAGNSMLEKTLIEAINLTKEQARQEERQKVLEEVEKLIVKMEDTPPPHMQMWESDQFVHIYTTRYKLFKASIEALKNKEVKT